MYYVFATIAFDEGYGDNDKSLVTLTTENIAALVEYRKEWELFDEDIKETFGLDMSSILLIMIEEGLDNGGFDKAIQKANKSEPCTVIQLPGHEFGFATVTRFVDVPTKAQLFMVSGETDKQLAKIEGNMFGSGWTIN